MTPHEVEEFENQLRELEDREFRKGAALSAAIPVPVWVEGLFAALEAEDIDSIRYVTGEMSFWLKLARNEKDESKKILYERNVLWQRERIKELHHDVTARREFKKELSRV